MEKKLLPFSGKEFFYIFLYKLRRSLHIRTGLIHSSSCDLWILPEIHGGCNLLIVLWIIHSLHSGRCLLIVVWIHHSLHSGCSNLFFLWILHPSGCGLLFFLGPM